MRPWPGYVRLVQVPLGALGCRLLGGAPRAGEALGIELVNCGVALGGVATVVAGVLVSTAAGGVVVGVAGRVTCGVAGGVVTVLYGLGIGEGGNGKEGCRGSDAQDDTLHRVGLSVSRYAGLGGSEQLRCAPDGVASQRIWQSCHSIGALSYRNATDYVAN